MSPVATVRLADRIDKAVRHLTLGADWLRDAAADAHDTGHTGLAAHLTDLGRSVARDGDDAHQEARRLRGDHPLVGEDA